MLLLGIWSIYGFEFMIIVYYNKKINLVKFILLVNMNCLGYI